MNSKALSQVASGLAVFGLLALLILGRALGTVISVPANVVTIYGLLSPVVDQMAAWLIHGLIFHDWAIPVPGTVSLRKPST